MESTYNYFRLLTDCSLILLGHNNSLIYLPISDVHKAADYTSRRTVTVLGQDSVGFDNEIQFHDVSPPSDDESINCHSCHSQFQKKETPTNMVQTSPSPRKETVFLFHTFVR